MWGTVAAGLVAVAGTGALFTVGSLAGLVDGRVMLPSPIGNGSLSLASVSVAAAVAVVGASIVLGLLAVTAQRPVRIFRIVATTLALASLLGPATVSGAPTAMRLLLVGMHVVVWAACVCLLPWLASRRPGSVSRAR